jgi:hypothetical protein
MDEIRMMQFARMKQNSYYLNLVTGNSDVAAVLFSKIGKDQRSLRFIEFQLDE